MTMLASLVYACTALAQAQGLALSPNGHELYVAGSGDSAVAILDRDPSTALLSFNSLAQNGVAGVTGLGVVDSVCADPGGESVYAGGGQAASLFEFTPDVAALAVDGFDFGLDFVGANALPGYTGHGGSYVAVASDATCVSSITPRDTCFPSATRCPTGSARW